MLKRKSVSKYKVLTQQTECVCVCVCVCVLVIQGRKGVLPYLNVDWFLTFAQRGV